MERHQIVNTSRGEVMVKEQIDTNSKKYLECYIGDNFDDYIGEIDGSVDDDSRCIVNDIELYIFGS